MNQEQSSSSTTTTTTTTTSSCDDETMKRGKAVNNHNKTFEAYQDPTRHQNVVMVDPLVDDIVIQPHAIGNADISKNKLHTAKNKRLKKKKKKKQFNITGLESHQIRQVLILACLTLCCWFGCLWYSHSQLSRIEAHETDDDNASVSLQEEEEVVVATEKTKVDHDNKDLNELKAATLQYNKEVATKSNLRQQPKNDNKNKQPDNNNHGMEDALEHRRLLIFDGGSLGGQGIGNIMNGLLATHLLADEYNRTVCVDPSFFFHYGFELKDDFTAKLCHLYFQTHPKSLGHNPLFIVNYLPPPDECKLQQQLASNERKHQYLHIEANTYPRWSEVPPGYFFQFYQPKDELLKMLPYNPDYPPSIVVHLRQPDGKADFRRGLDLQSLETLGKHLATQFNVHDQDDIPYLVTNNVEWFQYFEGHFHWRHPQHQRVIHSALGWVWGDQLDNNKEKLNQAEEKKRQKMQIWSDWYSILKAKRVYHTHSDFSASAIHWMGSSNDNNNNNNNNQHSIWSRKIMGVDANSKELLLEEESWFLEGAEKRLVDRQGSDLQHCRQRLVPPTPQKKDDKPIINAKPQRLMIEVPAQEERNFMQDRLSIDPQRVEQYKQWQKEKIEYMGLSEENIATLDANEVTKHVTEALRKRQQAKTATADKKAV